MNFTAPTLGPAPVPESVILLSTDFVQAQFIDLIARQSRRIPIGVLVIALVIAGITAEFADTVWPFAWLLAGISVVVLRWHVLSQLPQWSEYSNQRRVRLIVFLSGLGGVIYAASLFSFASQPVTARTVHTLILLGMVTGAVATSGGHKRAYLAYAIPIVLPLAALWAWSPGLASVTWIERSMGLLILMYLWILLGLVRDTWNLFVESCEIRFQELALNTKLQAALEQADAANRAKTRFLAAASHDLRQPLHTLTLLGAALAMRQIDQRSKEIVVVLNEVTDTVTAQLDGLLDISKLDAGIVQADISSIKINDVLSRHFSEIESIARAKGLQPQLKVVGNAWASTDAQLLLRILRNLTQNAIRFTSKGQITLEMIDLGKHIQIAIEDTGCGIGKQHVNEVFQEFYQVDNAERDRTRGLGLGLSIVRRLCELLNIELTMHSVLGSGTRFTLLLPKANPDEFVEAPPAAYESSQFTSLTVLVIDDEKSVRLATRTILEEMGCNCLEAMGTTEAVAVVRHTRPDLVLADFRLRGQDDGIAAIRAVCEQWPDTPAVLVSGDTAPDRLREAERAGIRLLQKPLSLKALQRELQGAQRQSNAATAARPTILGPK